MYRRCLFCAADLGENQVIEHFPVGRRLAFDPEKGRLWAICRQCERWNLSPLEERWEALEELERTWRGTSLRVSTEQIGLARHREGLEMVRVGRPLRPEFAAWRYGDQFGRRRRRYLVRGAVGVGIGGAVVAGSVGLLGTAIVAQSGYHVLNVWNLVRSATMPKLQFPVTDAPPLLVKADRVAMAEIRPGAGSPSGEPLPGWNPEAPWHLNLPTEEGPAILVGQDAVRALGRILPRANASGAGPRQVREAVRELEEAGGPEAYFVQADARARKRGWGWRPLSGLPPDIRLALEMAAHEDAEQVALEGELAWLEEAWREAEELAAISDALTLPERVRIRFDELRARREGKRATLPN
jgi:hypothetical protein